MENPQPIPLFDPPLIPDEPLYAVLTAPTLLHGHNGGEQWADASILVRVRCIGPKFIRVSVDDLPGYQASVPPSRLDIP